ncbi:MAG: hypothetical protein P8Y64_08295 [Gammaproteobacteria bacterium]
MPHDDETYLARFQARDLGPEYFDHKGHLYMAWLHLNHYDLEEANTRVCEGIHDLADKFGAPEKFNHTLSEALMRIMAKRIHGDMSHNFEAFLAANPDLVTDARGVLARHFSEERLTSPEARAAWVEPDREPID